MNRFEFFTESELYLPENESEVRDSTSRAKEMKSKSLSAASRSSKFDTSRPKEGISNQNEAQNRANFITLGKISEQASLVFPPNRHFILVNLI